MQLSSPAPPADPAVAEEPGAMLLALDRLVRAYQFRDRQGACYQGLSVTECYALQAVIRGQGLTQGELAAELWLDKSTTSRVVGGLEAKGCLTREPDPSDGRAYRLAPTRAGRARHARIQRDLLRRQEALLGDLPGDVRRSARIVLERLAADAAARFGGGR